MAGCKDVAWAESKETAQLGSAWPNKRGMTTGCEWGRAVMGGECTVASTQASRRSGLGGRGVLDAEGNIVKTELICRSPARGGMVQVDHRAWPLVTMSSWLEGGLFMTENREQDPTDRGVLAAELGELSLAKRSVLGGRKWLGVNEMTCQWVALGV